jgi:hypothetical protein
MRAGSPAHADDQVQGTEGKEADRRGIVQRRPFEGIETFAGRHDEGIERAAVAAVLASAGARFGHRCFR